MSAEHAQTALEAFAGWMQRTGNAGRPVADVLVEQALRLNGIQDAGQRAAAATSLFGDASRSMAAMLSLGSDGIAGLMGRARQLGGVLDANGTREADRYAAAVGRLSTAWSALKTNLGAEVIPAISAAAEAIGDAVGAVAKLNRALSSKTGFGLGSVLFGSPLISGYRALRGSRNEASETPQAGGPDRAVHSDTLAAEMRANDALLDKIRMRTAMVSEGDREQVAKAEQLVQMYREQLGLLDRRASIVSELAKRSGAADAAGRPAVDQSGRISEAGLAFQREMNALLGQEAALHAQIEQPLGRRIPAQGQPAYPQPRRQPRRRRRAQRRPLRC